MTGFHMDIKRALPDHPIVPQLAERWSPYGFADRPVSDDLLCSLFEAARWAPSSYNEQPWHYIVAKKVNTEEFKAALACLDEANQEWAKAAPVLAFGVVALRFKKNHKENRAAVHDLGLASANLVMEATAHGVYIHQMIGIDPGKIRETYQIPKDYEAWTGLALGYKADPATLPAEQKKSDETPRQRKPLRAFVFSGSWNQSAPFLEKL